MTTNIKLRYLYSNEDGIYANVIGGAALSTSYGERPFLFAYKCPRRKVYICRNKFRNMFLYEETDQGFRQVTKFWFSSKSHFEMTKPGWSNYITMQIWSLDEEGNFLEEFEPEDSFPNYEEALEYLSENIQFWEKFGDESQIMVNFMRPERGNPYARWIQHSQIFDLTHENN